MGMLWYPYRNLKKLTTQAITTNVGSVAEARSLQIVDSTTSNASPSTEMKNKV